MLPSYVSSRITLGHLAHDLHGHYWTGLGLSDDERNNPVSSHMATRIDTVQRPHDVSQSQDRQ